MKAYKKRAKGSWHAGKSYKGDSEERQFSKREIRQLLREDEEEFLYRHRKSPRARNEQARLEYRVFWYSKSVEYWDRNKNSGSFVSYLRSGLKEAQAALKKFLDDKEGRE